MGNAVSAGFDSARAVLREKPLFQPFYPQERELSALAAAMERGKVEPGQNLLVTVREGGTIALDQAQMSYHHVAQGELAGEPWLVAF